MNKEQRGNWYLLTGLILGLSLGLVYSWLISPVKYTDTNPASLNEPYQDQYWQMIALAYQANHNLERARERAELLAPENPSRVLAAQAQRMIAANASPQEARALAVLAADLREAPQTPVAAGVQTGPTSEANPVSLETTTPAEVTGTPEISLTATIEESPATQTASSPIPATLPTSTLDPTPLPSFTPRASVTPLSVVAAPFVLKDKQQICNGSIQPGLLQVEVTDVNDSPVPGIQITVSWKDGEDVFVTGLIPEVNPGYADFMMQSGTTYSIRVGTASSPLDGLSIPECGGGWRLKFMEERK